MNNQWQKRVTGDFTCSSGNQVKICRPSPSIGLKTQRFLPLINKMKQEGDKDVMTAILDLPDEDVERITSLAEIVLADCVVQPKLSLKPKPDQLSPSDLPVNDFWELFFEVSRGCPSIAVKTKEGETTVDAVSNFPGGQESGADVSSDSEAVQ